MMKSGDQIMHFVIASVVKQSVSLLEKAFKLNCINPIDWFNETPIRTLQ